MVTLIYFIMCLSNIIYINSQNELLISNFLRKIIPNDIYNKIKRNYNLNIQIIENKNITHEFLINTSYFSKDFPFEFFYTGKLFYLTDKNLDILSEEKYDNQWIFLIGSNSTFNKYISNNRNLIKHLTKAIIVPKNSILTIDIIAKYCLYDLSIYLIEIEEKTFIQLLNNYANNKLKEDNYYVKIISKKYEIFPYIKLYGLLITITFILFSFSLIYKYTLKKFKINLKEKQLIFIKDIQNFIDLKICILFLIFLELNLFYDIEGFILDYSSFIKILAIIFMVINKASLCSFIFSVFYGIGIFFKERNIYRLINYYLSSLIILFYILFHVFISPLKIPKAFYILSMFIHIPTFSTIIFYSIKNIIFLCRANSKIKHIKRFYDKYGNGIRLKIIISFLQIIIYFFYIYFFLILHKYLLFKKGLCFEIEKDILFECLDSCLISLIALIYIPKKYPNNFALSILIIKDSIKSNKIIVNDKQGYKSNIPKENLTNEKEIKKFVKKNKKKYFSIINPKLYLDKEKKNNINKLENHIKIGKLILS